MDRTGCFDHIGIRCAYVTSVIESNVSFGREPMRYLIVAFVAQAVFYGSLAVVLATLVCHRKRLSEDSA